MKDCISPLCVYHKQTYNHAAIPVGRGGQVFTSITSLSLYSGVQRDEELHPHHTSPLWQHTAFHWTFSCREDDLWDEVSIRLTDVLQGSEATWPGTRATLSSGSVPLDPEEERSTRGCRVLKMWVLSRWGDNENNVNIKGRFCCIELKYHSLHQCFPFICGYCHTFNTYYLSLRNRKRQKESVPES